jgi:hypothetical protein
MQVAVGRKVVRLDLEAAFDKAGARFEPLQSQMIGQVTLLSFRQLLDVISLTHLNSPQRRAIMPS